MAEDGDRAPAQTVDRRSVSLKFAATGQRSERQGNQAVNTAPRNIYLCTDGKYVALSASVQAMFERLARAIGRDDLLDDPRFANNESRVRNSDALNEILAEYFSQATLEEHLAVMDTEAVTVAPVLSAGDLVEHPYAEGRGLFEWVDDDDVANCPLPTAIPRLSQTPGRLRRQAPELGEHTAEILSEIAAAKEPRRGSNQNGDLEPRICVVNFEGLTRLRW